eukprot:158541-Chlamydomonas_euryale.AAC.5
MRARCSCTGFERRPPPPKKKATPRLDPSPSHPRLHTHAVADLPFPEEATPRPDPPTHTHAVPALIIPSLPPKKQTAPRPSSSTPPLTYSRSAAACTALVGRCHCARLWRPPPSSPDTRFEHPPSLPPTLCSCAGSSRWLPSRRPALASARRPTWRTLAC